MIKQTILIPDVQLQSARNLADFLQIKGVPIWKDVSGDWLPYPGYVVVESEDYCSGHTRFTWYKKDR